MLTQIRLETALQNDEELFSTDPWHGQFNLFLLFAQA
jgi:hypothetical protein